MSKTFIKIGAAKYDAADYSLPAERTFRQAWTAGANPEDGVISVDMDKARDVWREKIRIVREDEFSKLDAEFMKALETGNEIKAIADRKKALRDAPADAAIEAAQTPEELKAVQPAGLKIE